jgi:amino acid adenylation domain-containing protein
MKLLYETFLNSLNTCPHTCAIIQEHGRRYTYAQIGKAVSKLTSWLNHVITPRANPYVGVLAPVHAGSITSVLAILGAGGAYVPLDEYSPVSRLKLIIENTNMKVLFMDKRLRHLLEVAELQQIKQVVWLDYEGVDTSTLEGSADYTDNILFDDLAYVLHSSGSTGIPKGIMLTHRNAVTFVDWMQKEFKLTMRDVVMSRAPLKFDLSVFDIFNTFNAGATLACFDWLARRENKHKAYVDFMGEVGASILYTTPSTFMALVNQGDLNRITTLRTVMYAGEPFPVAQLKQLRAALPETGIANIYGPTETNIITCYWIKDESLLLPHIPLGKEVEDTEIRIVKEVSGGWVECEAGELGELWCRGGTVTLGYLKDDEKTRKHLVPSPFHTFPAWFWRTGDFGFRDTKGVLHYRGRRDHIVKVKGYRIELGEVEAAVAQCKGVTEFAVVFLETADGNKLVLFYTGSAEQSELELQLRRIIPVYMLPRHCIPKSGLPMTSSEKVDRVLLAEEAKQYV